ncbi:unnamed protein product, partial [Cladocopium goreaui]
VVQNNHLIIPLEQMSVPWPLTGLDVGFGLLHCLASEASTTCDLQSSCLASHVDSEQQHPSEPRVHSMQGLAFDRLEITCSSRATIAAALGLCNGIFESVAVLSAGCPMLATVHKPLPFDPSVWIKVRSCVTSSPLWPHIKAPPHPSTFSWILEIYTVKTFSARETMAKLPQGTSPQLDVPVRHLDLPGAGGPKLWVLSLENCDYELAARALCWPPSTRLHVGQPLLYTHCVPSGKK